MAGARQPAKPVAPVAHTPAKQGQIGRGLTGINADQTRADPWPSSFKLEQRSTVHARGVFGSMTGLS